jgi:5'-phosphate synthase pdxT subunit
VKTVHLTVGVLALQGDVAEHFSALGDLGARPVPVRRPEDLREADALVIPGGESTTIVKLADAFDLTQPLKDAIAGGLPVLGSCAGMVLLARDVLDGEPDQTTFGGLDITVRRNAFGRQVDSFEQDVTVSGVEGGPMRAVFIRAPWVEEVGDGVEVLARTGSARGADRVVAVAQGPMMACSFHPELTPDRRLHALFLKRAKGG